MTKTTSSLAVSALSDKEFVEHVYTTMLDRPVDSEGLATYTNHLEQDWTRGQLLGTIRKSDEASKRLTSIRTSVESIVYLLCLDKANDVADLLDYRLQTVSLETLWTIAEQIVTNRRDRLSASESEVLFGEAGGWIGVPSNMSVSGFILDPSRASRIQVSLNGQIVSGALQTQPHDALNAAGTPAVLFTIPIDPSKLSDFAVNFLTVTVEGEELFPITRGFSPWIERFTPTFKRLGLERFHAFGTTAFHNGSD